MRVLLPFYRRDSSDSSSSSDEEEIYTTGGNLQNAAFKEQEEERSSSSTVGEPAVQETAAREERLATSKAPAKPKESSLEKKIQPYNLSEEGFGKAESKTEPQPREELTKLPSKSSERTAKSTPLNEEPQAPFASSHPVQKHLSLAILRPEFSAGVSNSYSQDENPKKRQASDHPLQQHSIESGVCPRLLLVSTEPNNSDSLPPPAISEAILLKGVDTHGDNDITATFVAKRSRTDSKPSPQVRTHIHSNMAVGGKRRSVDDSEDYDDEEEEDMASFALPPANFWVQPAENEPPVIQNHPPPKVPLVASAQASSNPDDPAQDTQEEEIQPVAAAAAKQQKQAPSLDEFQQNLKTQGLEMVEQEGDGNCLFRAVSLQVYGQSDNHAEVRERCLDFMEQNEEHYSAFVATGEAEGDLTFQDYIARKRGNGVHGNNPEIQAISELYNRPVEVYTADSSQPMNIFHAEYKTSDPPIRLSYHDGNHYNAVVDPLLPTAGCGLGLPGLQPGLADKMQLTKAKTESDELADEMELERVMKESKAEFSGASEDELQRALKESSMDFMYKQKAMALSDLDETNFELEQKVLASSLESYRRQEHGRKQRASPVGRRRHRSSPPLPIQAAAAAAASAPSSFSSFASIPPAAAAAVASVPEAASLAAASAAAAPSGISADGEYPETVQELVMNGFELSKVVRAYDLIGDNFDNLLAFLLSSSSSSNNNTGS